MLLALAAVALADTKPEEVESVEPVPAQARDKRGVLLGAAYTAPLAYSAYSAYTAPVAPVAYSAYSALPYAYSAYPYYSSAYSSPYIVA